jgi:GntR family transcriptional regulator, transcriptional repressor for pyruvate dehydrogenase complex
MNESKIKFELKPIETKKRYALVIDQISNLIKKGVFRKGDKLPPERVMAKKLGVSRPSVREAYSVLEIAGILESRVGSGTYVQSENINDFFEKKINDIATKEESPYEIFSLRKIIEPEIVALAAKNAKPENIFEIGNILKKMQAQIKDGQSYTLETDRIFHITIAKASGNSVLLHTLQYILDLTEEDLWKKIREQIIKSPEHLTKDIEYHEKIFNCIRNKDIKNARLIMKKHFTEILKEMSFL